MTDKLIEAAQIVISEFGTSSDGLLALYQALKDHRSQQSPPAAKGVECVDPMCACHGGPCAECLDGEREKELADLRSSLDFFRRRVELLQEWQKRMRDPERTIVCDIIANGQMLPDASGKRYGTSPAPSESEAKDAARYRFLLSMPWTLTADAEEATWRIHIPKVAAAGSDEPQQFIDAAIAKGGDHA